MNGTKKEKKEKKTKNECISAQSKFGRGVYLYEVAGNA